MAEWSEQRVPANHTEEVDDRQHGTVRREVEEVERPVGARVNVVTVELKTMLEDLGERPIRRAEPDEHAPDQEPEQPLEGKAHSRTTL